MGQTNKHTRDTLTHGCCLSRAVWVDTGVPLGSREKVTLGGNLAEWEGMEEVSFMNLSSGQE